MIVLNLLNHDTIKICMYKIINIVIKATIYIVAFIKGEIFMDFINKVKVALVDTVTNSL